MNYIYLLLYYIYLLQQTVFDDSFTETTEKLVHQAKLSLLDVSATKEGNPHSWTSVSKKLEK